MMETNDEDIVIVGGGITGLSVALALHRLGLKALVLESSDTLRATGAAFGTWTNAWKALDALGVADSLRRRHFRHSRIIATSLQTGLQTADIPYGNHEFRCLKRKVLLETLAKELPSNTIRYSSKLVSIEKSGYSKLLHLADGSILRAKVVIGCDGVNSVVAQWLGFNKPTFTGRLSIRGQVGFEEDHGIDLDFTLFTGYGKRFGVVPCDARTIYWFFTWTPSKRAEQVCENPFELKEFVLGSLGKVQSQMKAVVEKTKEEDIVLSSLRYRPPWELLWRSISKDNICVAGDAFHPMTPDLGQGACAALEDAIVLARCLAEALSMRPTTVSEAWQKFEGAHDYKVIEIGLKKYAKERKWRGIDLIATAYFVGCIQQSNSKVIRFLRDRVLGKLLTGLRLKKADFDCGPLRIC